MRTAHSSIREGCLHQAPPPPREQTHPPGADTPTPGADAPPAVDPPSLGADTPLWTEFLTRLWKYYLAPNFVCGR